MNKNFIRSCFPFFTHNPTAVYLDNAATTHKPHVMIKALVDFYEKNYASIQRGLYPLAENATEEYEHARTEVALFIHAASSQEIVFTKGTTEGVNYIAESWGCRNLTAEDEILLTIAEHHANLLSWQRISKKTGATLRFIDIDPITYQVNLDSCIVSKKTKILAVTLDSNVLGNIWGLDGIILTQLIQQVKKNGGAVFIDAAQAVAHKELDVQKLEADFVVFSGHKIFGPTGVGVLYIQKKWHNQLDPFQVGGGMVYSVEKETFISASSPQKFEAGTPPIASVIGLGSSIKFINNSIDYKALAIHEALLCSHLINGLLKIEGVTIIGNIKEAKRNGHLVSFFVENIHSHDLASYMGSRNVAIRAGNHCAQQLLARLHITSLLRASVSVYNTLEDVDIMLKELEQGIKKLKKELFYG